LCLENCLSFRDALQKNRDFGAQHHDFGAQHHDFGAQHRDSGYQGRENVSEDILTQLMHNPKDEVRVAIAKNPKTPASILEHLLQTSAQIRFTTELLLIPILQLKRERN
jgi:hypothetical protein